MQVHQRKMTELVQYITMSNVRRKMRPIRRHFLWWLSFFGATAIMYVLLSVVEIGNRSNPNERRSFNLNNSAQDSSGFIVDTAGCRIPNMPIWNKYVTQYYKQMKKLDCVLNKPPLTASNANTIFVQQHALSAYHIRDIADLSCCYINLFTSVNNTIGFGKTCKHFRKEVILEGYEFVAVRCYHNFKRIYIDYHALVPKKPNVENRTKSTEHDKDALSVLVFGLDSVSRLNIQRQMPKTIQKLKELDAIEMFGFNKLGEETFPNMIPLLAGVSVEELTRKCWPNLDTRLDGCRFIWDEFREAGYQTVYGEDSSIISNLKEGFEKQPTDYFLNPFHRLMEKTIGNTLLIDTWGCLGSRMNAEVLLDYVLKYFKKFKTKLIFGLFWEGSLSHDDLNYASLGDDVHAAFLENLKKRDILNRSALFFLSDHGSRAPYRETYQGRMESNLPYLFLVLPKWFRERYPTAVSNAQRNAQRLTTFYDTHETMHDLMRPTQRLSEEALRQRAVESARHRRPPRGISLFQQISPNRTCFDAEIPLEFCSCHENKLVYDVRSETKLALFLVKSINEIIQLFQECSPLILGTVERAEELQPPDSTNTSYRELLNEERYYVVVLQTIPGNAVFEGTLRHEPSKDESHVVGSIRRISAYRNQSKCMDNYRIKPYCVCRS